MTPIPVEKLRAVADEAPAATVVEMPTPKHRRFQIEAFITANLKVKRGPVDWSGRGRKWELATCPFNEDHVNGSSVVTESSDGKLGFHCSHNGCIDKHWKDLRELYDPRDQRSTAPRESKATRLLNLLTEVEYFHSPENRPFATFVVDGHTETYPIRSRGFRLYLQRRYHEELGTAINGTGLDETLGVLEAKALFQGKEMPVFCRVGEANGNVYIDLGNKEWSAIEVTPGRGWQVIADCPIRFRRARGMMPLPRPTIGKGGKETLAGFVNTDPARQDLELITAWVMAGYRPRGPFPVLILNSTMGSGKTTLSRLLRSLLDPNEASVRSQPKEEQDLMIAASNSWVIVLDNLSHIPDWLSDGLCRISTGGALAKRELYSDDEETLLNVQRPVLLNGIEEIATRGDLMDRAIIVELPQIEEDKRKTEKAFWSEFEAARPAIMGYLLDAVSSALANLGTVKLVSTPRMADFAEWIQAGESALGWEPGTFLNAYKGNRQDANDLTIDAAPIGRHVLSLGIWDGTAAELLTKLNTVSTEQERKSKAWPQSARGISNALRRLIPSLKLAGMVIEFERKASGDRERLIHLTKVQPVTPVRDATGTIGTVRDEAENGYRP